MNNKKNTPALYITIIAFSAVLNYVGANIALILKLPIYLDTIGTFLTAALLGPFYALIPGFISGIVGFITTDIFSLYYMPVQLITGFVAGMLFKTVFLKKQRMPLGTLLVTIPGTIVSSLITVILFGGITSSGSSIIVQFLHGSGLNLTVSIIIVQLLTDYLDRFIGIAIAAAAVLLIPADIKSRLKPALKSVK